MKNGSKTWGKRLVAGLLLLSLGIGVFMISGCQQQADPSENTIEQNDTEETDRKKVSDETIKVLSGKSALFLGDSIMAGMCDNYCPYSTQGWAGRIGHYCKMQVQNNGVSGACISNIRVAEHGDAYYIYNNLVKESGNLYDYVILHGLYNDAGFGASQGGAKGPEEFDPNTADPSQFADALELLFYTARQQYPDAKMGFIVNFRTEDMVTPKPFVKMAIEICKLWDMPYLDLYYDRHFEIDLVDGLHPSSSGYEDTFSVIADWMADL